MLKFSVIVPVYNVEDYLGECVQSVIQQSFTDWELILVDDGSQDNSPAMCDEYAKQDSRIKCIHKENGGASGARNTGLEYALGEYILFLDGDDFWNSSEALNQLNKKIFSQKSDVVVFGCTDFNMSTNETVVTRSDYDIPVIESTDKNEVLHYFLCTKKLPGGPTVFAFDNELVKQNGIKFKTGIQNEDYDFVLSVFLNAKSFSAINEPFYMYRKGRSNSVTGSSNIKMIYGIDYTLQKWLPISETIENDTVKRDVQNYLAFVYTTGFVVCGRMDKKTRKEALKIMRGHTGILKYAYWKKTIITKYAVSVSGANLFSVLAAKYYDRVHV